MAERFAAALLAALFLGGMVPAGARAQERVTATGRVIDIRTGEAVSGAAIARTDGTLAAVSDASGRWQVVQARPGEVLRVRHVGYAAESVVVPAISSTITLVELTPRPVPLDALVVTSGRRTQRLADAVVATEVVSRREVRETGASDAAAVLTERTGIDLVGGHPTGAGVMLQGLGAERVLVLIDGQPFIGRVAGNIDLSRIPAELIERIEVVKGPQSTLYGSEAMGGVVNVITRAPDVGRWSGSGRATMGTEGRADVGGEGSITRGSLSALAQLGHRSVALAPGRASESGALARRWDGSGRARWSAGASAVLEFAAFGVAERQRWRTGQLYQFADNRQWGARLGGTWQGGSHRITPMLFATSFRHAAMSGAAPEPVEGTGQAEDQRLAQATLLYAGRPAGLEVNAGLELRQERLRSPRLRGGTRDIASVGAFTQATLEWGPAAIVPGVRLTSSREWGSVWTPSLAALVRPLDPLSVRAAVSAGYRAPEFKELAMEFLNVGPGYGYVVRGNPLLRPERSTSTSATMEWAGERLYLRAQGFHTVFDDFIETQLAGDSASLEVYTYGNISAGRTQGVDAEAATAWRSWRVEGGYAWLRAVAESGEALLGQPTHAGRVSLSFADAGGTRVTATALHTGRTPIGRDEAGVQTRSAYTRIDVHAARSLGRGFEVSFGTDNLFDARPAEWPGFTGRQFYATLRWVAGASQP
jgi:outer membrane receptor for ferrienterochelin and colicins